MDSLTTAPITGLLIHRLQQAETVHRPLAATSSNEGRHFSPEQLNTFLADKAEDYLFVARPFETGSGNEFTVITR